MGERIALVTPYDKAFVEQIKTIKERKYTSHLVLSPNTKPVAAWSVPCNKINEAKAIAAKCFGEIEWKDSSEIGPSVLMNFDSPVYIVIESDPQRRPNPNCLVYRVEGFDIIGHKIEIIEPSFSEHDDAHNAQFEISQEFLKLDCDVKAIRDGKSGKNDDKYTLTWGNRFQVIDTKRIDLCFGESKIYSDEYFFVVEQKPNRFVGASFSYS